MAMLKLFEGAVYMHEGQTYVVQQCDTSNHFVKVQRNDVSYYTEPRDHTRVTILGRTGAREAATAFKLDPQVSFQWKNPDFLFRNPDFLFGNPDFLFRNPDFLFRNPDFVLKNVETGGDGRGTLLLFCAVCTDFD